MAAVYYFLLVMDGSLDLFRPLGPEGQRGMTFNSMLEHLLHGEFDVDPAAITSEGQVRDGKTYTYFGIIPALLRLPLLPTGALARLDVTRLYCALAATVALCFKLASVVLINDELPKSRLQAIAFFVLVLSLLLGGAQIQFLRGSIYQETIEWAGAISAAFIYCAVRGLIAKREFSTGVDRRNGCTGRAGAPHSRVDRPRALRCCRAARSGSRLAVGRPVSRPAAAVRTRLGEQAHHRRAYYPSGVRDAVQHSELWALGRPA
jgi:hypothetical protein